MTNLQTILVAMTVAVTGIGTAQAAPVDPVAARAGAIRDRFVAAIHRCGANPSFVPPIKIDNDPTLVSYFFEDRSVHLSRWDQLPPPLKDFMAAWAAQGTMGLTPEQMFGEIFNDFLVAHELGHYLEHMSGRIQTLDPTDAETEANQIALAFWSTDKADRARLPMRYENFTTFPVPATRPGPARTRSARLSGKELFEDLEGWFGLWLVSG